MDRPSKRPRLLGAVERLPSYQTVSSADIIQKRTATVREHHHRWIVGLSSIYIETATKLMGSGSQGYRKTQDEDTLMQRESLGESRHKRLRQRKLTRDIHVLAAENTTYSPWVRGGTNVSSAASVNSTGISTVSNPGSSNAPLLYSSNRTAISPTTALSLQTTDIPSSESNSSGTVYTRASPQVVISSSPLTPLPSNATAFFSFSTPASEPALSGAVTAGQTLLRSPPLPTGSAVGMLSNAFNQSSTEFFMSAATASSPNNTVHSSIGGIGNLFTSTLTHSDASTTYTATTTINFGYVRTSQIRITQTLGLSQASPTASLGIPSTTSVALPAISNLRIASTSQANVEGDLSSMTDQSTPTRNYDGAMTGPSSTTAETATSTLAGSAASSVLLPAISNTRIASTSQANVESSLSSMTVQSISNTRVASTSQANVEGNLSSMPVQSTATTDYGVVVTGPSGTAAETAAGTLTGSAANSAATHITATASPATNKKNDATPPSVIAGGAVGGVAGLALILLLAWALLRWRHRRALAAASRGITLPEDDGGGGHPVFAYSTRPPEQRHSFLPAAAGNYVNRFTRPQSHDTSNPSKTREFQKVTGRKLPSRYSPGLIWDPHNQASNNNTYPGTFYHDSQDFYNSADNGTRADTSVLPTFAGPSSWGGQTDKTLEEGMMRRGPARVPVIHPGGPYSPTNPFADPISSPAQASVLGTSVREQTATLGTSQGTEDELLGVMRVLGDRLSGHEGSRPSRFTEDVT